MARKWADGLLILVFLGIICVPLFSPLPSASKLWKQDCSTSSPACRLKAWSDLPANFNAYFSDHYRLHSQEVTALETVRLDLLHEKTFPNVLIGKDDCCITPARTTCRITNAPSPSPAPS
jgi:hypothetical protein